MALRDVVGCDEELIDFGMDAAGRPVVEDGIHGPANQLRLGDAQFSGAFLECLILVFPQVELLAHHMYIIYITTERSDVPWPLRRLATTLTAFPAYVVRH